MSLHPSLKTKPDGLNQHRNVLTRTERVARLMERGEFDPETDSPTGLVKIASRQDAPRKKKKAEKAEDGLEEGIEGTEAAEDSADSPE